MATNMQAAMAKAAANAKSPNALEARNQEIARTRKAAQAPAPANDFSAQLAAMKDQMEKQMQQFAALLAQKDEQIAELKASKPAKAEKPTPAPENMGISISGNILTITVDLSKDTGKDTANGANRIVAQQNSAVGPYKFTHAGKEHWLSCCVARPYDNAKELRAAYKAAKKQQ